MMTLEEKEKQKSATIGRNLSLRDASEEVWPMLRFVTEADGFFSTRFPLNRKNNT